MLWFAMDGVEDVVWCSQVESIERCSVRLGSKRPEAANWTDDGTHPRFDMRKGNVRSIHKPVLRKRQDRFEPSLSITFGRKSSPH